MRFAFGGQRTYAIKTDMGKLSLYSAVVVVVWRKDGTFKSLLSKQQSSVTFFGR